MKSVHLPPYKSTQSAKSFKSSINKFEFFKSFNTIPATCYAHYPEILNFFDNRRTNASAVSFNAKLKAFRAPQRGVVDIEFFLFRVTKIYA